jgi:hypothetical protein
MQFKKSLSAGSVLVLAGFLVACNHEESTPKDHPMGETVTVGPLRYNVIESNWYGQLGEGFKIRSAQQRFLAITLSITNGGGSDVAVPLLSLENSNGQSFVETENGDGLDNWLGLLRNVSPAQTVQGKVLFDVPLGSYKLRLTDGAGAGVDKYSWVTIPLHIDTDTGVQTPTPGDIGK